MSEQASDVAEIWRWWRLQTMALSCLGVWVLLVIAFEMVQSATSDRHSLCLFHNITGVPCVMCGGTRAVAALGHGNVAEALAWNPLAIVALGVGSLWLAVRPALGLPLKVRFTSRQRRAFWTMVAMLAMSNWVWVIARGN